MQENNHFEEGRRFLKKLNLAVIIYMLSLYLIYITYFKHSYIFELFILIPVANFIPLGILLNSARKLLKDGSSEEFKKGKVEILGGSIAAFSCGLYLNISIACSKDNMVGVAFFILPFFIFIVMEIGSNIGRFISKYTK